MKPTGIIGIVGKRATRDEGLPVPLTKVFVPSLIFLPPNRAAVGLLYPAAHGDFCSIPALKHFP